MPLSHMNWSAFSAPTNVMTLGHPFASPAYNDTPGVPLGIDPISRQLVVFDPWLLMKHGVINTLFGILYGLIRHGKSSTIKILIIRLIMIAAGFDRMHVQINDYKPEGRASEYKVLTDLLHCAVFAVASSGINPFDPKLFDSEDEGVYTLGMLGMAETLTEFVSGEKLTGENGTALRVAMHAMLQRSPNNWLVTSLHKHLLSITEADVQAYRASLDTKLQSQLETRLTRIDDPGLRAEAEIDIRALVNARSNDNIGSIQTGGLYAASLLERILDGSYGAMFGTNSLYDMLTQRLVTLDWRGMSTESETLGRLLLTNVKMSAIEQNKLQLIPHLEADDEKHKSMDNLQYAKSAAFEGEIARGIHTCSISATHRPASILKGGVGSELYAAGQTIIRNMGWVFMGLLEDDVETLNGMQQQYGLSNWQTRQLTSLPPYTFGLKLGQKEKLRYVRVFATPLEMEILQTGAALDRMTDRPDVFDQADLKRFAEQNGVVYLGADELGDPIYV